MSSTNKTSHYELSQFIGTDKPAWLTDYNGDMLKIDTGLAAAAAEASGAQGTATSAASAAQAAQNTANQAVTSAAANAEDLTELKGALSNTVDSMTKLGNINEGNVAISYSDYIQVFKIFITYTALPNNTAIEGTNTVWPIASIPGNIFKIAASTITDSNSKVYLGRNNITYNTSSSQYNVDGITTGAYYDGSNTIVFLSKSTSVYSAYTEIKQIWGTNVCLFSGNFISPED